MTDALTKARAAVLAALTRDGVATPPRWRTVITDSESPTGVAPVCTEGRSNALHVIGDYPGGPIRDEDGVYDCCPWPQFDTYSQDTAAYLVALLNADGEAPVDRRAAARNEAADWFASYPFPSSDSDWERGRDDALAWAVRVLRNPDPQRGAATGQGLDVRLNEQRAKVLAEAKTEVIAWLLKKGREQAAWYTSTLASKVDRGAVRIFLGTGHYRDAMDEHRVEVLNEALGSIRECLRAGGQQQKGLLLARKQILALIDGTTPEPPRRNVSHKQVAARCRQKPGEWQTVGEYATDMSAGSIVSAITKGGSNVVAYGPAGAFEARSEQTEAGTAVYARYVGDGGEPRG